MYELTGEITNVTLDFKTKEPLVTFRLKEKYTVQRMLDNFKIGELLTIVIDKFRKKRSIEANRYAWKLITEIANAVRLSKEEVYLSMLEHYGQSEMINAVATVPIHHYLKYYKEIGEMDFGGVTYKNYIVYKGSSEFDTKEMSIFIDGIVHEAKQLGIETMTPDEIARMKSLWKSVDEVTYSHY